METKIQMLPDCEKITITLICNPLALIFASIYFCLVLQRMFEPTKYDANQMFVNILEQQRNSELWKISSHA